MNSGFSELRRIQSGKDAQILTFDVNTGVLNIKTKMTPPISTPPIDENGEAANDVVPLVAVSTIESSSVRIFFIVFNIKYLTVTDFFFFFSF